MGSESYWFGAKFGQTYSNLNGDIYTNYEIGLNATHSFSLTKNLNLNSNIELTQINFENNNKFLMQISMNPEYKIFNSIYLGYTVGWTPQSIPDKYYESELYQGISLSLIHRLDHENSFKYGFRVLETGNPIHKTKALFYIQWSPDTDVYNKYYNHLGFD